MSRIIFELNEFSLDLLELYKHKYKNINKILKNYIYRTKIKADYKSNYLEPWCQWISIHTGIDAESHKIQHLGDCSYIKNKQAWEINKNIGLVWGCLNSSHGARKEVLFFPDPWSTSQNTNIKDSENILKFLRLSVQGRSKKTLISLIFSGIKALYSYIKILKFRIFKIFPFLLMTRSTSELYGIFEYLNLLIFLKVHNRDKIKNSIFFANTLAHYQHYYWSSKNNYKIEWCLKLIDRMIHDIFEVTDDVMIINGLSQENSDRFENWFSYIPKGGFEDFFKKQNFLFKEIIPCMSYDCIVTFNNFEEKKKFILKAKKFKVADQFTQLFLIDDYEDVKRIFLRMNYYGVKNINYYYENKKFDFNSNFETLARRTGRHIQRCDVISTNMIKLDKFNFNEEIHDYLIKI